jgi:ferredoxin
VLFRSVIDGKKCTACGKCVSACPKNLIEIAPEYSMRVLCHSKDIGRVTRRNCRAGCMACSICQKLCPTGAITIENNVAHIDYDKCTLCKACVEKCPTKAIKLAI